MTFAQPLWLVLMPVVLAAVLLLHARRKRDVIVPSLVVWRTVPVGSAVSPSRRSLPWRDPLLWLQLLAVAVLTLALARPEIGGAPPRWVVVVDASLSMTATDPEPDRLAAAAGVVMERWGARGAVGSVSLVSAGPRARLLAADRPAGPGLAGALIDLEAAAGPADWLGAAVRAAELAAAGGRVAVITDDYGGEDALAALASVGFARDVVEVVIVGGGLANVGVTDVRVEPRGDRSDRWTASGSVVTAGFARGDTVRVVASYRPPGAETFLPWGAEDVVLGSDGTGTFAIPLDLPGPGEVQVRGPAGDHLPADDAAVVVLDAAPVRVGVVGAAHPALLRALAAVGGVEAYALAEVPPPGDAASFDLVVVTEPVDGVPATSTLWLGAVPDDVVAGDPTPVTPGSLVSQPHRLTADMDASALSVVRAVPLLAPTGASPLLVAGNEVLAWARTTSVGRQVVVGFDLDSSDWHAQVSFPAFVASLLDWVAPRPASTGCRVGEPCSLPREAFAGGWELLDPAGRPVPGLPQPEAVSGDPLAEAVWRGPAFDAGFTPVAAGVYTLVTDRGQVPVPVQALPLRGEPAQVAADGGSRAAAGAAIWRWLAAVAALLVAGEAYLARQRQSRQLRRRRRGALALAGLAVVAVVLALASVPLPTLALRETVVWVGAEAPPDGVNWRWVDGSVGEVSGAVERALVGPEAAPLRVVVAAASGEAIDAGSVAELSRLAANVGARVDVVVAPSPDASSSLLALAAVDLPDRVRSGARFTLKARVEAPPGVDWHLEAVPTGPEGEGAEAVGSGPGAAELALTAGSEGDVVYRLLLHDGSGAQVAVSTVSVHVGPPPTVLTVAVDEADGVALQAALEAQGLEVERTTPFRMPGTLERLGAYDAIVLVDIAASEVFPEYQELLERYVREVGGGLLMVGGPSAFGPGGYYATPFEELSPLSSRVTDEAPEVAMAFVIDRSGSMGAAVGGSSRMDVAKAAALEAVRLLGERSLATVIVFDTVARVLLPLTSTSDVEAFTSALAAVTAAGGTAIYPGLVAATEAMSSSPSATRHVVVLTDGLSQEGDFAGVLSDLRAAGVTVTFVGVGEEADRRQLTTLASLAGGTLHMARDFRALPSLLAQEALMLSASPVAEGAFAPRWTEGRAPAFLDDVAGAELPTLSGYVRTTPKDEATVHAYASEDDPLLATWRYGLGRVVAFTSDAGGSWSGSWLGWEGYGRTWAQLVRWAADRSVREPWSPRVGRRGDVLDVVVDLPDGVSPTELPLVSLAVDGGEPLHRRLELVSASRAAASFAVDPDFQGALTVTVQAESATGDPERYVRTVAWPMSPGGELRPDLVGLADLAAATGGAVHATPEEALSGLRGRALRWRPAVTAWLVLALLALLSALAVRYGVSWRPWGAVGVRAPSAARTRTAQRGL